MHSFCAGLDGSCLWLCEHGAHRSTGSCLIFMCCVGLPLRQAADLIEETRYVADLSSSSPRYASSRSRVAKLVAALRLTQGRAVPQTAMLEDVVRRPRGEPTGDESGRPRGEAPPKVQKVAEDAKTQEERPQSQTGSPRSEAGRPRGEEGRPSGQERRPRGEQEEKTEEESEEEADYGRDASSSEGDDKAARLEEVIKSFKAQREDVQAEVNRLTKKKEDLTAEKRELQRDLDGLENDLDKVELEVTSLRREREMRTGEVETTIEEACALIRNHEWQEPPSQRACSILEIS